MRAARLLPIVSLLGLTACGGSSGPASPTTAIPGTQACVFTPAANPATFDAVGGTASVVVAPAAGCRWTIEPATNADAWIVFGSPTRNVGPASISIAVDANRSFASRDGRFVVRHANGDVLATYNVTQRGAGCLYSVSPQSVMLGWMGTYDGSGDSPLRIAVRADPATCQWTATPSVPWITVVFNTAAGTGEKTIYLRTLVNNFTPHPMIGDVAVAGLSGVNPDARVRLTVRKAPFLFPPPDRRVAPGTR